MTRFAQLVGAWLDNTAVWRATLEVLEPAACDTPPAALPSAEPITRWRDVELVVPGWGAPAPTPAPPERDPASPPPPPALSGMWTP